MYSFIGIKTFSPKLNDDDNADKSTLKKIKGYLYDSIYPSLFPKGPETLTKYHLLLTKVNDCIL